MKQNCRPSRSGFTLIELSIVMVIIGLIVGGVLVGRDLIRAAELRATISQIEKYNAAVHTFETKYKADLPGDMPTADAAAFGFTFRPGYRGNGDGNGLIEGSGANTAFPCAETVMFWNDLSTANLIEGSFVGNSITCNASSASVPVSSIIPLAKLGRSNYIIVYADNGINFFQIIGGNISLPGDGEIFGMSLSITPLEANLIDSKIDDGLPTTGRVISRNLNFAVGDPPGPGAVGTGSSGNCGNLDTTPISYNTMGTYSDNYLCSIIFQFQ